LNGNTIYFLGHAMFCTCLDAEECMDVTYLIENMKPLLGLCRMYRRNLLDITMTPGHLHEHSKV